MHDPDILDILLTISCPMVEKMSSSVLQFLLILREPRLTSLDGGWHGGRLAHKVTKSWPLGMPRLGPRRNAFCCPWSLVSNDFYLTLPTTSKGVGLVKSQFSPRNEFISKLKYDQVVDRLVRLVQLVHHVY